MIGCNQTAGTHGGRSVLFLTALIAGDRSSAAIAAPDVVGEAREQNRTVGCWQLRSPGGNEWYAAAISSRCRSWECLSTP